jgi:hypothetical protein
MNTGRRSRICWYDVIGCTAARAGIKKYRTILARHGVGDILYHNDAKKTARGIKSGGYTD